MEFMQEEIKGFSEDQEEDDVIREESSSKQPQHPFPSPSLSSSSANYRSQENQWLGRLHDHHHSPEATTKTESHNSSSGLGLQLHQKDAVAINFTNRKLEDFMELSLGNKDDEASFHGGGCSSSGVGSSHHGTSSTGNNDVNSDPVQKEHMFDKVVTPSDVGKLNRLVIPKQHAEKYFPLDSSGNEKGLLLNFEDRNGKLWRFRYSYWNSSQSYVMTKGWSRFVKEKKLDAGDIVSFQRGVGESFRHRLYIDWRRRPDHAIHDPASALITPFLLHNQPHLPPYSIKWGGRLYSVPSPAASMAARHHDHLQQMNYNNMYPFYPQSHQHHRVQHQQQYHNYIYNDLNPGSGSLYYSRLAVPPSMGDLQNMQGRSQEGGNSPMIIDSVPVIAHNHGKNSSNATNTATKRLRLFGVNMECSSSGEEPKKSAANVTMAANSLPSSSSLPPLHLRAAHEDNSISSSFNNRAGFSEKVRTSMFFDSDPSLQYRQ